MNERFTELDALRGLAALSVVAFHYLGHVNRYFDFPVVFEPGRHGVQLFFVVSGFVIFWTLKRSRTVIDFAVQRFSRLYPTYWCALAVLAVADLISDRPIWLGGYVVNATMLQTFLHWQDLDLVFWTLAVELAFYVSMAAMLATGTLGRIVPVMLGWLALSAVWAATGRWLPQIFSTYLILPHIPYFTAGTMFYLLKTDPRPIHFMVIAAAAAATVMLDGVTGSLVTGVAFTAFGLAITGHLRFLVNRVTLWLGAISYALYVTHRILGYQALNELHARGFGNVTALLMVTVGALTLATLITYCAERPAIALIRDSYRRLTGTNGRHSEAAPNPGVTSNE